MKKEYPGRAITKEEKILKGTYREDRHGPIDGSFEPETTDSPPDFPDDLDPYMRGAWESVTEQMHNAGILRITDLPMLQELMRSIQTMEECWREMKGKPTIKFVDSKGNSKTIANPANNVYNAAFSRFKDISAQFGLSPIARQKIRNAAKKMRDESPINKIDKL